MKNWFTSFNGAVMLSAITWLTELWRAWLDMLFEYTGGYITVEKDSGVTLVLTLVYTAVFAGWAYAMYAAARGSRGGLVTSLVFNILVWLALPVSWLTTYCTGDCPARAGILFNTANSLNLVFGLLAALALAFQLRRRIVPA